MHHESFTIRASEKLPENWLVDGRFHSNGRRTSRGDSFAYRKHASGNLDVQVQPSWGGPFQVDGIPLRADVRRMRPPIVFRVVWTNPYFHVFLNTVCLLELKHPILAKAVYAGIPFGAFLELSPKEQYEASKRPESGLVLALDEIPGHVTREFGVDRDDPSAFLNAGLNRTQEGRELYDVWSYAHLLALADTETTRYYSVLKPSPDRGTDAYLRIVDPKPLKIADIPIQVSEIRTIDQNFDLSTFAAAHVAKAKQKRGFGERQTLLCSLRGHGIVPVDGDALREAFIRQGEWGYERIVLAGGGGDRSFAMTVVVREGCGEHFYLSREEPGKVDCYVGATLREMQQNRRENRGGRVQFRF